MKVINRFINYVKIDTQSDASSNSAPSTLKQLNLANLLVDELLSLGVKDAKVDEFGIVTGTIKANSSKKVPTIGFFAHLDTASEKSGANVKPRIIEKYDGKDIKISKDITMKVSEFPFLVAKEGKTLIVTDGSTLLGADDKAGIAIIMSMVEYLYHNKELKHGEIKLAFTPDEEIGRGVANFDVKAFNADFAYTIDGGMINDVEYENFNAASAEVRTKGISIHPGSAKNKLINSLHLAMEFHSLLPKFANPSFTEGYEGFNHLTAINGEVEKTIMHYIIRNHDKALLEKQKLDFIRIKDYLNSVYGNDFVEVEIKDTYKNMKDHLLDKMFIVDLAKEAIANQGLTPTSTPIRGGTDGANLTYMGLPCPNLGTGGYNGHGHFEFAVVEEMEMMVNVLINIIFLSHKKDWN